MAAVSRKVFEVNKLYRFKKPDILDDPLRSKLPDAYKKFYREWKLTVPSPVHYVHRTEKWERNPKTGEVFPVQNIPILPRFPDESDRGLWGGEGVVQGFVQKNQEYASKTPHFWFPVLKRSVIYSEILDKYMSVVLTRRAINLILDSHGLDNYLLKSRACDIQSELGVKLKRKMLLALLNKDLNHADPEKQDSVYKKYSHYLDNFTKEEIEWYGLNEYEAVMKFETEAENKPILPLKFELRRRLLDHLKDEVVNELNASSSSHETEELPQKTSWISKINPFSGRSNKT